MHVFLCCCNDAVVSIGQANHAAEEKISAEEQAAAEKREDEATAKRRQDEAAAQVCDHGLSIFRYWGWVGS